MDVDFGGVDGGRLAQAFAAGWSIAAAFFLTAGAALWKILSGAKEAQIKTLIDRIRNLENDLAEERETCRNRISALEGALFMITPVHQRAAVEREIRGHDQTDI